jgi:hypothetical protein
VDYPSRIGADLSLLGLEELRAMRRTAGEEEADLSYLRRLLQGRLDILRAELDRRAGTAPSPAPGGEAPLLLDQLPRILADLPSRVRSSARHVTLGTPRGQRYRALADALMGEVELADLDGRDDGELRAACARLSAYEREVSGQRQQLQGMADECGAEITRRYREGEAHVDDLLSDG